MSIALTVIIGLVLLTLGLWGFRRGVQRGLLTLVGTLLAATLVDLWTPAWGDWLRDQFRPERPGDMVWLLVSAVFGGVALVIGYGSGLLLPRPDPQVPPKKLSFQDRLMGGLLGALNGALLAGYLLRYTIDFEPDASLVGIIEETLFLRVLHTWLPWFILATVSAVALLILVRATQGMIRSQRASAAAAATATPSTRVADASSTPSRLQAVSNKIDEVLKEPGRK